MGRATRAILVVLWLAFALECFAAGSFSPGAPMLAALGGVFKNGIAGSGVYRLLTASLLHGGFIHILFNSLAFASSGRILESRVGAYCTLIVFTVSAVGGSLASVLVNDPRVVSVGASGAIMGIASAAAIMSFRMDHGPERSSAQRYLAQALVFNLLPLATAFKGDSKVDYGAHLGGALAGAVIGGVLFALSRKKAPNGLQPSPFGRVGSLLAVVCVALYALAVGGAAMAFPKEAEVARLRADDVLVADGAIPKEHPEASVDTWGKDRPRDPRVHLFKAYAALEREDTQAAEAELRAALAERAILDTFFGNGALEGAIRSLLVKLLVERGSSEEAKKVAEPACRSKEVPKDLRAYCDKP